MKKTLGYVAPVILLLAVFIFMVEFKQGQTLSAHEKQDTVEVKQKIVKEEKKKEEEEQKKRREKLGVTKKDVYTAQRVLNKLELYDGDIDGDPDKPTRQAIRIFQKHHALKQNGKPDEDTLKKLQKT